MVKTCHITVYKIHWENLRTRIYMFETLKNVIDDQLLWMRIFLHTFIRAVLRDQNQYDNTQVKIMMLACLLKYLCYPKSYTRTIFTLQSKAVNICINQYIIQVTLEYKSHLFRFALTNKKKHFTHPQSYWFFVISFLFIASNSNIAAICKTSKSSKKAKYFDMLSENNNKMNVRSITVNILTSLLRYVHLFLQNHILSHINWRWKRK